MQERGLNGTPTQTESKGLFPRNGVHNKQGSGKSKNHQRILGKIPSAAIGTKRNTTAVSRPLNDRPSGGGNILKTSSQQCVNMSRDDFVKIVSDAGHRFKSRLAASESSSSVQGFLAGVASGADLPTFSDESSFIAHQSTYKHDVCACSEKESTWPYLPRQAQIRRLNLNGAKKCNICQPYVLRRRQRSGQTPTDHCEINHPVNSYTVYMSDPTQHNSGKTAGLSYSQSVAEHNPRAIMQGVLRISQRRTQALQNLISGQEKRVKSVRARRDLREERREHDRQLMGYVKKHGTDTDVLAETLSQVRCLPFNYLTPFSLTL